MTLLGTYRAGTRLDLGASYTLSKLRGNIEGENINSGPLADSSLSRYPEYIEERWTAPKGDLSGDQRHKARFWGTFMFPMGRNDFTLGVLQQIDSGTPYGAAADTPLFDLDLNDYVQNPGYQNPPTTAVYYFTDRDAFRTQAMIRTDLSLNYQRRLRFGDPRSQPVR